MVRQRSYLVTLVSLGILIVFGYIYYSAALLEPRKLYLKTLYEELSPEEKLLPDAIKKAVVLTNLTERDGLNDVPKSIIYYVSESVSIKYEEPSSQVIWKLKNLLMRQALVSGLNETEVLSLYCHFIPFEKGHGMSKAAKFHYSKNLNELDLDEIISLLVIARSPSGYSPEGNIERYQNMKTVFMGKYLNNKERFLRSRSDD